MPWRNNFLFQCTSTLEQDEIRCSIQICKDDRKMCLPRYAQPHIEKLVIFNFKSYAGKHEIGEVASHFWMRSGHGLAVWPKYETFGVCWCLFCHWRVDNDILMQIVMYSCSHSYMLLWISWIVWRGLSDWDLIWTLLFRCAIWAAFPNVTITGTPPHCVFFA